MIEGIITMGMPSRRNSAMVAGDSTIWMPWAKIMPFGMHWRAASRCSTPMPSP
ncbi:MAG: hypothetical protein WDN72_09105 [Alphaproteobacteria bacterium]